MKGADRRAFLAAAGALLLPAALRALQVPADTSQIHPSVTGAAGFLPKPALAGVSQSAVTTRDNDPTVIAIEHRVRCPCPCGLDVYTCRTTDFTCSYSPERHREILALVSRGMTADQVVADLVARYGESTLMAPPPKGFNLFGYLVPGSLVLLLGAAITSVILSRRRAVRVIPAGAPPAPGAPPAGVSAEEMERLERAMRELDP